MSNIGGSEYVFLAIYVCSAGGIYWFLVCVLTQQLFKVNVFSKVMVYLWPVESNYRELLGKQCMVNSQNTGIFPGTLQHAQDHCTADKSCSGIYHNYCTDQPPFFLCTKNELDLYPFEESTLTPLSCVYEKDGR